MSLSLIVVSLGRSAPRATSAVDRPTRSIHTLCSSRAGTALLVDTRRRLFETNRLCCAGSRPAPALH